MPDASCSGWRSGRRARAGRGRVAFRRWGVAIALAAVGVLPGVQAAFAEQPTAAGTAPPLEADMGSTGSPARGLSAAAEAFERGALTRSIDLLEQLSDRGQVQPGLSFNRGLAYLRRAESSAARPSDLGQAAAGFQEALLLDPSDEEARLALSRTRERITTSRRGSAAAVRVRPRLLRALVELAGEQGWAVLGSLGALVLSVGLGLKLLLRPKATTPQLAAVALAVAGGCATLLGGGLAWAGLVLRTQYQPAVVTAAHASLLDSSGRPMARSALADASPDVPPGSTVYVAQTRGGLCEVEWGSQRAWLQRAQLRTLVRP